MLLRSIIIYYALDKTENLRRLFTKDFLNLSIFNKGSSRSCPLCLKVRFNLLGKSSLSALFLSFNIFSHNLLSLLLIISLKLDFSVTYPLRYARFTNLSI